ncbi:LolA-like protein [Halorussus amylolyticus]|uniref:hypothetical protein n=1 Tax=Halorussus amylolyticus TaxID=1126242 RepID=UPI00105294AA|nr:hypothetical protein [Halorussus amylolyticus]
MSADGDALPTNEIIEQLLATDNLPEEIHGVQRKAQEFGGGRMETRLEIWERPPVELRKEVVSAKTVRDPNFEVMNIPTDTLGGDSDVLIKNEGGIALYDSETNRYHEIEFETPDDGRGYIGGVTLIGSSPKTDFDVTYDGTDAVAGRETHVLTFRPTEDADVPHRGIDFVTLWVDGTYWFPLKREVVHDIREGGLLEPNTDTDLQDETYFQTEKLEEVEFNTGMEDFRFRLPEDSERVE